MWCRFRSITAADLTILGTLILLQKSQNVSSLYTEGVKSCDFAADSQGDSENRAEKLCHVRNVHLNFFFSYTPFTSKSWVGPGFRPRLHWTRVSPDFSYGGRGLFVWCKRAITQLGPKQKMRQLCEWSSQNIYLVSPASMHTDVSPWQPTTNKPCNHTPFHSLLLDEHFIGKRDVDGRQKGA